MMLNSSCQNCCSFCKFLLVVILTGICLNAFSSDYKYRNLPVALSDAQLIAIRDGYDKRVNELFDAQKGKSLSGFGKSGWNAAQQYAYPRIEYATVNLLKGLNIDSANIALVQYGDYFINNPTQVLHRDNFHWHSEMAMRLIEMFGKNGTKTRGLLKPATEDKILEAVWLYSKRQQKDQIDPNTKAEADTDESNTWYIYESENHHSQSLTTQWHFAKLAKDRANFKNRVYDDGEKALFHYNAWNKYLNVYFTERAKKGMFIEMMSQDYNEKTLKGIFNVYDFAEDPGLRRKAGLFLDLFFTYWGQEQLDGISGGGKSRIYSDIAPSTSDLGYFFFGIGDKAKLSSPMLTAMTTNYRPSLVVIDIACDVKGRGNYEVSQRPLGLLAESGKNGHPVYHMRTDFGGVIRYSYCTPDFILGTLMTGANTYDDWALISSQNRCQGVIFSGNHKAGILPEYEKSNNNRAYNSFWSVQSKGTLITQKLKESRGTDKVRIWFAADGLSTPSEKDNWVFAESDGAYTAVLVVDGKHYWVNSDSSSNGKWLYCENEYSPVILEVDQKSNYKSFDDFKSKITAKKVSFKNNKLNYTGIYNDAFTFYTDYSKVPEINNKPIDYAPKKAFDSPFLQADWNSGIVKIQKGTRSLVLNFNK